MKLELTQTDQGDNIEFELHAEHDDGRVRRSVVWITKFALEHTDQYHAERELGRLLAGALKCD